MMSRPLMVYSDTGGGGPVATPIVGGIVSRQPTSVTNYNTGSSTAGASAISATSQTQHASPTLVQPAKAKGDYWWLLALAIVFLYFEWKK